MTTLQSLKSITAYPIPTATLKDIAEGCGLRADAELTTENRSTAEYKRAKAHVYLYLLSAPNISQNGVSFSFTSEEKKRFKAMARNLLTDIGDDTTGLGTGVKYGYVGENF